MPRYRRARITGACYFFTVVTYRRQPVLCDQTVRHALRDAIGRVREKRPFTIDAWVLLPDHLHCLWTLPPGDADYSTRWNMIKRRVSVACAAEYKRTEWLTESKRRHRESTLWQRRFWEHHIRDQDDFNRHMDYLHHNPVKHGLCNHASDWRYSTFHRYVARGVYPRDWCGVVGDGQGILVGE